MEKNRKFLGVHYKCCNIYARAYVNKEKRRTPALARSAASG